MLARASIGMGPRRGRRTIFEGVSPLQDRHRVGDLALVELRGVDDRRQRRGQGQDRDEDGGGELHGG